MATKPPPRAPTRPKRPAHLPHGRWLGDFKRLSAAEKALVAACGQGKPWMPDDWDEKRPEVASPFNRIRAELIRFLLLGGDGLNPVHELGVMLGGAWINGILNLYQARCVVRLQLARCHFDQVPDFSGATLPELGMPGTAVPGMAADGIIVKGDIFLRNGFAASGEVRLLGAQIGGDLSCSGGSFTNDGKIALSADRMIVKGGVFLREGFAATGEVRLSGVEIGGNLDCSGGAFTTENGHSFILQGAIVNGSVFLCEGFVARGVVSLLSATIGGNLDFRGGTFSNEATYALIAQGAIVKGASLLREVKIKGAIDLATAKVGTLADDIACWASGGHILDGFHYERIVGPIDAPARIDWLKTQRANQLMAEFKPQPWEQLIKVLREMGHLDHASAVAIAKQEALRAAGKIKGIRNPLHWIYGALAGYGYRPMRTVGWMAALWLAMSLAFWAGADRFAAIGPANPVITSEALYPEAGELCGHGNETGKARWTECPGVPDEYSTFQPFIYSLDLILPLVDLQQETDWAPIAEGPTGADLPAGVVLRWLMWFEILFGWLASLTLVAVLGRLVEKD